MLRSGRAARLPFLHVLAHLLALFRRRVLPALFRLLPLLRRHVLPAFAQLLALLGRQRLVLVEPFAQPLLVFRWQIAELLVTLMRLLPLLWRQAAPLLEPLLRRLMAIDAIVKSSTVPTGSAARS